MADDHIYHHYYSSSTTSTASSQQQQQPHHSTTAPRPLPYHTDSSASYPPLQATNHSLRKPASLAQISVPSFSAFRSQTSSIPVLVSPATARRKNPAYLSARSPRSASVSLAERASPRIVETALRPFSIDSPLPTTPRLPQFEQETELAPKPLPHLPVPGTHARDASIDSRLVPTQRNSAVSASEYSLSRRSSIPIHERYSNEHNISHAPMHSVTSSGSSSGYSASKDPPLSPNGKDLPPLPGLKLEMNGITRTMSADSLESPKSQDPRPKSPVGKLGAFFGWKSSPQTGCTESPTTTFSDRSHSPASRSPRLTPPGIDLLKAQNGGQYDGPETPFLIGGQQNSTHVKELETELEHVSTELAGSIKREMELEDELDRLRAEIPNLPPSDRRGSDYFSDSGASSTRYPISNVDERVEELETKLRKAEQEKAQAKMQLASRIQAELTRRKELEERVQQLEDQHDIKVASDVAELQTSLDDTKRRLSLTKQEKENLEELYAATKVELSQYRNERDNLRDEVVPALKARVEGLEAHAADSQAQMYEHSRMEYTTGGTTPRIPRFETLMEEGSSGATLSRSSSLANRTGLNRNTSVKDKNGRQRTGSLSVPLTAEGLRELENQRDALHKSLKLLLSRHDKQQKEHRRAIERLATAKSKAEAVSPGRSSYHREVSLLKDEVTTLRRRTEDALEQKWEYEKGLGGLKMDLDRAEQETRTLREMLQERAIVPGSPSRNGRNSPDRSEPELNIAQMEKQRDETRRQAYEYRKKSTTSTDPNTAQQLVEAADRLEKLAGQLDKQVESNKQLRQKLSDAVTKGEQQQKISTRQIQEMQKRLASMEDSVLSAQQHSETMLGNHEAEARRLEDATSPSLQRLRISIPDGKLLTPTSPSPMGLRSPRSAGRKLANTSLLEASRTVMLERKVKDLEGLLREADDEMTMVVQRVNRSQLEVAELQTERDAALVQMRKLQNMIVEEKEKADGLA